ncbi:elongator complex protein [Stachybotrys elegans]|uniref:Elongator complex protein 1 n=1 Tax=Stachybotrys elegans TaxID=80388 RepID=A0A8K0SQ01_9HYPO|nr:elongator complex protein [Stachybotrys elegans]
MRNLRNLRFGRWRSSDITATCWDPENDDILCTRGPTPSSSQVELVRVSADDHSSHHVVAAWEAPSPSPDLPVDEIVCLHHLSGIATTCIVFRGGDIYTVQHDDGALIQIVGTIDAGIAAARWSPDEELLVVVTKADTVIFMGATFDPVAETTLTEEDLKASKQVSVGWGKKETQFEGRGVKALRDPTIPERVDEGVLSEFDDGKTTISWRGDGAFVAINAIQGKRRVIRVYSREGELDGASEAVDGLESCMSWRPAGNLIASVQRRSDRTDVVFFERNGLRHGEFTLRSSLQPITSQEQVTLEWNSDSTVLAVVLPGRVQLWTMGNYYWYLKQELPADPGFKCLSWHPEKALRFAAASAESMILAENIFHTARGFCRAPHDIAAVVVIDEQTVKLTPFRAANIPPPMSKHDLRSPSTVVDVAFGHENSRFAVLHYEGVQVYEWPVKKTRLRDPVLKKELAFKDANIPDGHIPLRICTTSEGNYRIMSYSDDLGTFQIDVLSADLEAARLNLLDETQIMLSTAAYDGELGSEGYGQDKSGSLYRFSESGVEPIMIRFPSLLPWFEVSKHDEIEVAFGLSRNGHLYANSKLLTKSCTSFVLTPSHLIFTTNNHLVKFVHLTSDVEELEVPADDPEKDERCRNVERGSRLVTAIPTNMSIVLQMPRGNLETIFPRAMVVAGIRSLIESKDYGRAFAYCRTQRVDMNLLYDHQPEQFLSNVSVFLTQLKEVSYIDLFLSSLREEDVTQTMYKDTKRPKIQLSTDNEPTSGTTQNKVNTICDAILSGLQSRKDTNLQNIITAHVCKVPPALDDGLTLVAELMQEDEKVAEKAVEHICFLVDVNRVYENALGLYNLDLALLVAQQSQHDPREYLPFIQNLHALPELRRKFEIDDHLGRRVKALGHLQALEAFDELCSYTTKYTLYKDALRIYRYDQPRLRTLTELYAEYLESMSIFREAGLAYESLQNYNKATSCYLTAGAECWQECLFVAQLQDPPPSAASSASLASDLAEALWEAKDYSAAAKIHLEYLDSIDMAIKCLCKGYHFADAIRIVIQKNRPDLLESAVDVGLAEALGSMTEFLADCKGQLLAQVPRIAELRRKAAEDPLAFYEGERAGGGDIPDDVSVAASSRLSTGASLFTRYTGKAGSTGTAATGASRATSKNRRREEKKRARGRKGTVYEEEYLTNSVRRLVERVEANKPDIERLVFALARRGMAERARAAESLTSEVVEACQQAIAEVFPPNQDTPAAPAAEEQQHESGWKATGGEAVFQEWALGQGRNTKPPVLTQFNTLTLLGS